MDNVSHVLGYKFLNITLRDMVAFLGEHLNNSEGAINVFPVNADVVVKAANHDGLSTALKSHALLLADGMPLVWLSRLAKEPLPERVAGSDLVERLCGKEGSQFGFFLLGAGPGLAELAAVRISNQFGTKVCGTHCPSRGEIIEFEASMDIVRKINASGANTLLVGFGVPLQEEWIVRYQPFLATRINIAVGGSIDFLAGRIERAPEWVRLAGLEWFYRFLKEPKRLWKRYFFGNCKFLYIAIRWVVAEKVRTRLGVRM